MAAGRHFPVNLTVLHPTLRYLAMSMMPLLLCAQNSSLETRPYNVDDAYEVYSAVLEEEHATGELLIDSTTVPFDHCLQSRSNERVDSAIKDYKSINAQHWELQRKLGLKQPYELVSGKDLDWLSDGDPRGGLKWRFPLANGVYHLSAVGFSADRRIAFLEMDFLCGGFCGHGEPKILENTNGKWRLYHPTAIKPLVCSWSY